MIPNAFIYESVFEVSDPVFICTFYGWGNALNVSSETGRYLVEKLSGKKIARMAADPFHRFDESRPPVEIENGLFKTVSMPDSSLYAVKTPGTENDLLILLAEEPALGWERFGDEILALIKTFSVKTVIAVGGMFDQVLHTDTMVSAAVSRPEDLMVTDALGLERIHYSGPGAVHSVIHQAALQAGLPCFNLWANCPYFVRGITHWGLVARMVEILGRLGNFHIAVDELKEKWKARLVQIETLIKENAELRSAVEEIRKARLKGVRRQLSGPSKNKGNVIDLYDFFDGN
jgi:proteasome assembly chaperone (PAC2) family protein